MSTNDVTGDKLITKQATDAYRDGWDRIFGKKPQPPVANSPEEQPAEPTCNEDPGVTN